MLKKHSKGFSIAELVIALALGCVLVVVIAGFVKGPDTPLGVYDRKQVSNVEVYYPKPTGYVVDDADVLSTEVEAAINAVIYADFSVGEVPEIAVVTVKTTQPLDEAQYAINLASRWGVGDSERDDGVLFLVVTEDRKVRIEVGTGLEGRLTDAEAGRILDNHVVPALKDGDWARGVVNGFSAIVEEVSN